ncbi:MAG TPA: class I SAM-dependent methyltransferase [Bacteroidia bacterium]|nr:class I SAM-dependent methyltransferase [Bacteroidia bacterium]
MDPGKKNKTWYQSWFDSPYYHLLYFNRDQREADAFILNLVQYLKPALGSRVLDLACGKGRHALALHRAGLDVTGIDLSPGNILEAKKLETQGLTFFEHDMRRPFRINYFDGVFNLFTSFGYFRDLSDDKMVMDAVAKGLKPGGFFVIDFFNAELVEKAIAAHPSGEKTEGQVHFRWQKRIEDNLIIKEIFINEAGKEFHFTETVQLLRLEDFRHLLVEHFDTEMLFGDYSLVPFAPETSKRLIILARKR